MFTLLCTLCVNSSDCLRCLCGVENLKELRLRDEAHHLSNPACMLPSYASDVIRILPALTVLDGLCSFFWGFLHFIIPFGKFGPLCLGKTTQCTQVHAGSFRVSLIH